MVLLAADDAAAWLLARVRRSSAVFHMTNDVAKIAVATNKDKPANIQLGANTNVAAHLLAGASGRGAGSCGGPVFKDLIGLAGSCRATTGLDPAGRGRLRSPGRGRRCLLWLLDKVKADHLPGRVGIGGSMQVEAQSVGLVDCVRSGSVGRGGNQTNNHHG